MIFNRRAALKLFATLSGITAIAALLDFTIMPLWNYLSWSRAQTKSSTTVATESEASQTQSSRTSAVTQSETNRTQSSTTSAVTKSETILTEWSETPVVIEKKRIANVSDVPPNSVIYFQWPAEYDYDILISDKDGNLHAYNRRCTHMGCRVDYNPNRNLIVCRCHGSAFKIDTGEKRFGPAPRPLPSIKLEIGDDGEIYAVGFEGEFG